MSFIVECMFGKNRDFMVSITLLIVILLWLPWSVIGYPETSDFPNPGGLFLISLIMISLGCLIHLAFFIISQTDNQSKYDILYLISMTLILFGDIIFLIFGIFYTYEWCSTSNVESNYNECWWGSFLYNLAIFFMFLYLIELIFINRCIGHFKFFKSVKTLFASNMFRLIYLIFCSSLGIMFLGLYLDYSFSIYTRPIRTWYYTTIALFGCSIIISLIISCSNNNYDYQNVICGPIYKISLFLGLNLLNCLFGCISYWEIRISDIDGIKWFGDFIVWSAWTVWVLVESFTPINLDRNLYQALEPI